MLNNPFMVGYLGALPIAYRADIKSRRQRIDCLDAHTVQADRTLVVLGVVLGTRVHLARCVLDLIQWDATSIVADGDRAFFHINIDHGLGKTSVELINAVVNDLLDENIDTVIALRSIAEFADVHARSLPDVLARAECNQFVISAEVAGLLLFGHQF